MTPLESSEPKTRVDGMSLGIILDGETETFADYFFMADVWAKDPRYVDRWMQVGQHRGLFRVDKGSLEATLLRPMDGDDDDMRFAKAAGKVVREWQRLGGPPKTTQFASG